MGFSNMMSGWGGGSGGWAMYLGGIVLLVGLVALVVWLVKTITGTPASAQTQPAQVTQAIQPGRETPMDALKRRYAAGEIDATEFRQKKADLS